MLVNRRHQHTHNRGMCVCATPMRFQWLLRSWDNGPINYFKGCFGRIIRFVGKACPIKAAAIYTQLLVKFLYICYIIVWRLSFIIAHLDQAQHRSVFDQMIPFLVFVGYWHTSLVPIKVKINYSETSLNWTEIGLGQLSIYETCAWHCALLLLLKSWFLVSVFYIVSQLLHQFFVLHHHLVKLMMHCHILFGLVQDTHFIKNHDSITFICCVVL